MSAILTAESSTAAPPRPHPGTANQLKAIVRLELRKTFPLRTLLAVGLLGLAPLAVLALRLIGMTITHTPNLIGDATTVFDKMFQDFTLRFILCLGSAAIFGNLVRREQLDRTLHFYLLSPVRRELVAVGKYLAATIVGVIAFGLSTVGSYFLAYAPYSDRAFGSFMFGGPGLGHLAGYLLVTAFACIAYGAVFLAFGTFVRNPVLPVIIVLIWESLHDFLPSSLQHLSLIHYLMALCPLHVQNGLFAVLTELPSPWLAAPVVLIVAAIGVALAALRMRGLQIQYDQD